jgi:hypothetical protein
MLTPDSLRSRDEAERYVQHENPMNRERPTSVKWALGVMGFILVTSALGAYGTLNADLSNGNSNLYNASGQFIIAFLAAIGFTGLWYAKKWAKWYCVSLLILTVILTTVAAIFLSLKETALVGFLVQAGIFGIPITYLSYRLGWGLPTKEYFDS